MLSLIVGLMLCVSFLACKQETTEEQLPDVDNAVPKCLILKCYRNDPLPHLENVTENYAYLIYEIVPKPLPLGYYAIRLSEPLPEARKSLVDIVLKFDRVVKSDLSHKGIFCLL